jgi:transcriptional regulator with XRE-family HTH domain
MSEIGKHIRTLRKRRQLSLSGLATRSGFSKGFLSKIENGLAQPPIATLMKLAVALGSDLGELFDGPRPTGAPASVLTRRKEREQIASSDERGYGFERLAVGSPFRMTPCIIHLDSDYDTVPNYQHPGEEMIFVLAGELNYAAGGRLHRLRKGDTLVFDATLPHGPVKLPNKTATYLAVFAEDDRGANRGRSSSSQNRKKVS